MTNQLEERRANRLAVKTVPAQARLLDQSCFQRKHQEEEIMMLLAHLVLPPTEIIDSSVIASVWLGIVGTLFLAYDLPGCENGSVHWFTLGLTCGLIRTLVFTPLAQVVSLSLSVFC